MTSSQPNGPGTGEDSRILDGVRVLDLTRYLSGPQATLFLADLGADVVRIDDPDKGDPAAAAPPFFGPEGVSLTRQTPEDIGLAYLKRGRGKKSVTIDLKSERGLALFKRLAGKADVVVENFRVGVTKRLGVDYETLSALNPGLVYCSITGFGADGPESGRKAYDLMVQASAGMMSVTGDPAGETYKAGSPISDGISGTFAVLGILGALFQRSRTGQGQFIDVSMTDCLVSLMYDEPWDCYAAMGLPLRQGNRIMRFSPFNTYPAADGVVALGAATAADWLNLLELMGRDDLRAEPGFMDAGWRIANNAAVDEVVAGWTAGLPVDEIVTRCAAHAIPCSPVRDISELNEWEQLRQRGLLGRARHPGLPEATGPLAANFPLKFSGADTRNETSAARHGEHNATVLSDWLGEEEDESAAAETETE
jgi:formyl-CoA transferase